MDFVTVLGTSQEGRDEILTPGELAAALKISPRQLQSDRARGTPILPYIRLNRKIVRYSKAEVCARLAALKSPAGA